MSKTSEVNKMQIYSKEDANPKKQFVFFNFDKLWIRATHAEILTLFGMETRNEKKL